MKFLENRLETIKVREPVLYLFLLKLTILFNATLRYVNKYFGVAKIFLKKDLNLV